MKYICNLEIIYYKLNCLMYYIKFLNYIYFISDFKICKKNHIGGVIIISFYYRF